MCKFLQTMRDIEMDSSDIKKNYNDKGFEEDKMVEREEDSLGIIKQNDVQTMMGHNKPKKANINVIPEGICFQCDYLSFVLYFYGIRLILLIFYHVDRLHMYP